MILSMAIFALLGVQNFAQNNITYSTLLQNQNQPFTKGNGEVLTIDGVAWERPYGESEYVIAPSMPSIESYRKRITQLDNPATGIFKSKHHFLNVEVTQESRSILKEMGIVIMEYVQSDVNVYLPEIDIDVLIAKGIKFEYLNNYGEETFNGSSIQEVQLVSLFSEGFEGAFPGSNYDATLFGSANCGWDDVSCYDHSGSWSVWASSLGAACNACLGDYVNNMGSEFRRIPTISTSGYNDFWFRFWMDYDFYNIGSNDLLQRYYWNGAWVLSTTSYTSASALDGNFWNQHSFFYAGTIPNYAFDFAFSSNSTGTSYGVYLDDILFEGTAISTAGIENEITNSISTYPNPCTESVTISMESLSATNSQIEIYSIDGKKIFSTIINLEIGNNNIKVNTENWNQGTYLIRLSNSEYSITQKIVKN